METTIKILKGMYGETVSLLAPVNLEFPYEFVTDFDSYCGAGDGFGDNIVPDKIWGIPVSPACFIHDYMWKYAEPSWRDFHHSNSIFLHNLNELIRSQSKSTILKKFRMYRAVSYYNAVDSVGSKVFWAGKRTDKKEK